VFNQRPTVFKQIYLNQEMGLKYFTILLLSLIVLLATACGSPAATSAPTGIPPTLPPATPTLAPTPPPTASPVPPTATTLPPSATTLPPSATTAPPTETSAPPTATKTAAAMTAEPASNTAAGYDGEWEGTSSTDSPISFTVAENQITFVNLNFAISSGTCEGLSGSYGTTVDRIPIRGNELDVQIQDSEDGSIEFKGTFKSPTQAAGTLHMKRKATSCGEFELQATWDATKAIPTPEPTAPTESPTSEASGAEIVQSFFDAINNGELGKALDSVDDEIVLTQGQTSLFGKADFTLFLRQQIGSSNKFTVSDLQDLDGLVIFSLQVNDGKVVENNTAVLNDTGKIEVLTLRGE
jgi:hypothetical protein